MPPRQEKSAAAEMAIELATETTHQYTSTPVGPKDQNKAQVEEATDSTAPSSNNIDAYLIRC